MITGESAPVIRESGGDRSAVTGGTRVLSDWIKVRITSNPGETFLDRMIALVEGAQRQKTPNEIALNILIAGLTLIFLLAVATLQPYAAYTVSAAGAGAIPSVAVLVSLLVCLIPTTIGGLLSAIGIAGMDRVMQHNVLAMSGKAVEASGDVHTLLLDKTGTITLGNRQAVEFIPLPGVEAARAGRRRAALEPRRRDARRPIDRRAREGAVSSCAGARCPTSRRVFIPFSAYTRMSGVDLDGRQLRKGAADAIAAFVNEQGGTFRQGFTEATERIARTGGTPLAVADGATPARPHPPEGRRQGRHEGSHRPASADGHPLGDDHRRQPADGGRHRQRGRRRRLPGAGDAEGQARVHQEGAGGRAGWSR